MITNKNMIELIGNQAIKIAALESDIRYLVKHFKLIHEYYYEIGGPLNDNALGFTKEQLTSLHTRVVDNLPTEFFGGKYNEDANDE